MTVRSTWVYRNGACVEKYGPLDVREPPARSGLSCPNIIGDVMPAIFGPGCVQFDSKSTYRRALRAGGYVELGNDAPKTTVDNRKPVTKADVGEAYRKVRDGYKPAPLEASILPEE